MILYNVNFCECGCSQEVKKKGYEYNHGHKKRALGQSPLCACGCGEHITGKKKVYIQGHKKKYLANLPDKFCKCGCGEIVDKNYKLGHSRRKIRFDKFCKCGCETLIKTNRTFVNGHNWKNMTRGSQSEEAKEKNRQAHLGKNTKENNSSWKGGITPIINKLRESQEYKQWIRNIYKRDNYTCYKCGLGSGNLVAHHIINFSKLVYTNQYLWDIDNGLILCKKCHKQFHQIFGYKNNDYQQIYQLICFQN